jgi:serine/threonine protein kinase
MSSNEPAGAAVEPEILAGRYALRSEARYGAQASVSQAYDIQDGRLVAIKRMRAGPHDARAAEGLQREIGMLESLVHPNIVKLHGVDRDPEGNWYLVLEWIPETLEDLMVRHGPMTWAYFWDHIGNPLLTAVVFAQKRRIAHRDIKPKNILVTADGVPKLADYGIAKLLDRIGAWSPAAGHTFRFDHTPGFTPSEPDSPEHSLSRDCYAFASVALACLTGRSFLNDDDRNAALHEAVVSSNIRDVLARCLSEDPGERPRLASVLQSQLERVESDNARTADGGRRRHLVLSAGIRRALERRLELNTTEALERFLLEELDEISSINLSEEALREETPSTCDLIGVSWRFKAAPTGRWGDALELTSAYEIGAALASEIRDRSVKRSLHFTFDKPRDEEIAGQDLRLLLAEAADFQRELAAEREARASQKIFRVWQSYLRDRADLEAKRANAIVYIDRQVMDDRVVFTTEIAQSDDVVGQERLVATGNHRVVGKVSRIAFNQVTLDVSYGDPSRLPRSGHLMINTIAAQKALEHQTSALNAVIYDRVVNPDLKGLVLNPASAAPVIPVADVQPDDQDFDAEKRSILSQALGVQGVLAIEGPPGTGKTKLITEIVVQWLKRNPNHRILLSSQTHIALDNVLERVGELKPGLDMIRIGRSDELRISDFSKNYLLERRVDAWIADIRRNAEADMQRWADENGVDRSAVAVGMKVERLLQVLEKKREMVAYISLQEAARADVAIEAESSENAPDAREADEETTQIDSEIGACRQALKAMALEETNLRQDLSQMGEYASALSGSSIPADLSEWADHFLTDEPAIMACRERLRLLEAWLLRVGRSTDFNGAMLASAQIIAGTCVGIAGVRGMEDVTYDLCIVDEASKATATEILIPMSRSRRWIVVGDPKQLPPFFEEFGDQIRQDFTDEEVQATLLDRFLENRNGLPDDCRAKLKNQYRMIAPIGDLVSDCFYASDLNSPITNHGLKLSAALPSPVTWYSTHKLATRAEQPLGKTFANAAEGTVIRDVLRRLQFVAKAQKKRISVAVIAGYTAQVKALGDIVSQGLAEWADLDVSCNSVDAFQGRQADVCIYSVVRSNTRGDLGFLREKPRLNVALSRGKSALVIVGDYPFCQGAGGDNPFKRVARFIEDHPDTCQIEVAS